MANNLQQRVHKKRGDQSITAGWWSGPSSPCKWADEERSFSKYNRQKRCGNHSQNTICANIANEQIRGEEKQLSRLTLGNWVEWRYFLVKEKNMSTRICFKEISGFCEFSAKLHKKRVEDWWDVLYRIDPLTCEWDVFKRGRWWCGWVGGAVGGFEYE